MKKRYLAIFAALALALGLAACGNGDTDTPPATKEPDTIQTQKPTDEPPEGTATDSDLKGEDREATGELVYTVGGAEQTVAAKLMEEENFSLYVPQDGWKADTDEDGKLRVENGENAADYMELSFAAGTGTSALKEGLNALSADGFDEGSEFTNSEGTVGTRFVGTVGDVSYIAYAFENDTGAVLVILQGNAADEGAIALMDAMVDTLVLA